MSGRGFPLRIIERGVAQRGAPQKNVGGGESGVFGARAQGLSVCDFRKGEVFSCSWSFFAYG